MRLCTEFNGQQRAIPDAKLLSHLPLAMFVGFIDGVEVSFPVGEIAHVDIEESRWSLSALVSAAPSR